MHTGQNREDKMLLKNCRLLLQDKEIIAEIIIENGKIAKIGHNLKHKGPVVDIKKKHVLPGIIDPHVHFREPGMTHKEDFLSGSRAAAAGGVTTFIDMPNTIPPTTTVKLLLQKRALAKKSIVNYGFHFAAAVDNIEEIKKVKNIASVKVFMNISTGKLMIKDDEALKRIFSSSRLITVHAEGDMVEKAIELSKECGNRLYLCHISAREELDYIRENKDKNIFAEATPHHLFLSDENDDDSFTKMKPSLKSVLDQEALLEAANDGLIDTIGTDHAPHTVGEKLSKEYPYGIPGSETMLPLLLNAVNDGRLTLQRIIELCCHNPARIFRIKNKGFLRPGSDADLTIVDMELEKAVDEDKLFTKCGWSPYNGLMLKGWPVMTIVGGNIVFDNGKIDENNKGREVEFQ